MIKKKRKLRFPHTTPRGQIRSALRRLWKNSRERSSAIKRDKYTCVTCGAKQSKAKGKEVKVNVHHISGHVDWEPMIDLIIKNLLQTMDDYVTLCKSCHDEVHKKTPHY